MRRKIDFRTGSKATYTRFCEENPDVNITFEEWEDITYMYSRLIRDYILNTGRIFKLPKGIGELTINKRKVKKTIIDVNGKRVITLPVDWKKTKEKGKKIYLMNHHTEGYKFSWLWMNKTSQIKLAKIWRFEASRKNSRLLASYLKSGKGFHDIYCEWIKK